MQAAHDILGRAGMVVLDEACIQAGQFMPGTFIEALEKKAALIPEYPGLQDQDIGDGGCDDFHGNRFSDMFVSGSVLAKRGCRRNTIFVALFFNAAG
jgi:hypothetical protein